MKPQRANVTVFACFIAATAFTFALAQPAALAVPNQCWEMTQESCTIGKIKLFVSDKAMRWEAPRMSLTFFLKAPEWKLVGYNDTTKKYMELTVDQMESLMRNGKPARKFTKEQVTSKLMKQAVTPLKDNKTVICGMKTIELRVPRELATEHHSSQQGTMTQPSLAGVKIKPYDMKKWHQGDEDVWFAEDVLLPPKVAEFLEQKMHGIGQLLPGTQRHQLLRSVHVGFNGSPAMALDTTECKRVPITASTYAMPKGYSKTDNEMALLMGVDESDMDILGSSSAKKKPY